MSTPELRKIWRRYWEEVAKGLDALRRAEEEYEATFEKWRKSPLGIPRPVPPRLDPWPEFPDECRGMMCGAQTRQGHLCRQTNLYPNGRCKFHGGASTGPVTQKGKRKAARNGFKRSP